MVKEYKSALGKVYLTIETDTENRWIFTDWQGYLTAENIKVGAKAYVDALAKAGFSCVLNDTRSVRGPWDHSMEWVLNEWAPSAARAGLRYFAMITTPETLADSSNATFYAQLTAFEAQLFDNMADAR
ncbi:STAS/SEC14 domain-containing protein, partial [Hymenobacter profundi]